MLQHPHLCFTACGKLLYTHADDVIGYIFMSDKHAHASRERWKGVSKKVKHKRMSGISMTGWGKLSKAERTARALKGVDTRKINKLKKIQNHESSN